MKNIKLIHVLFLSSFVFFSSCFNDNDDEIIERPIFTLEEPDLIDEIDYEIYSLIINERYEAERIVINQNSEPLDELEASTINDYYDRLLNESPNVEISVVNNLLAINNSSFLFDEKFVSDDKNINVISSEERTYIFNQNQDINSGWDAFFQQYENSNGILGFSRIGYNDSKTQAVLEMVRSFGSLGAYGDIIYLEKENGNWVIKTIIMAWAS